MNGLNTCYAELEQIPYTADQQNEKLFQKALKNIFIYISSHQEQIKNDLIKDFSQTQLLHRVAHIDSKKPQFSKVTQFIQNIHDCGISIELKVLLEESNPQKIAQWFRENESGFQLSTALKLEDFLNTLSFARKKLIEGKLFKPEVAGSLSKIAVIALDLEKADNPGFVKRKIDAIFKQGTEKYFEFLAHWINAKKIFLINTEITEQEMRALRPFLTYVDCRDLTIDVNEFISSCRHAFEFVTNSREITEFTNLPAELTSILCKKSPIKRFDFSLLPNLKRVVLYNPEMYTIDVSKNPELETLELEYDSEQTLSPLDLSKNNKLKRLNLKKSGLRQIDLSNNPDLETLICSYCPLAELDLSKNRKLTTILAEGCPFKTINFSNNPLLTGCTLNGCSQLTEVIFFQNNNLDLFYMDRTAISTITFDECRSIREISCKENPKLTFLGDKLPDSFAMLRRQNCPSLKSNPQCPKEARILF